MDYQAYIVRIRWTADGQPHGFVVHPRTGEKRLFHTATELLHVLQDWPLPTPPAPAPKESLP
ncbi:hypothetical protein A9Q02_11705 [Candidatus Chloroploca asiatica]|uniref:Uncharacterized protein n=1 Tax=Candidatus Chloroploca asiatica TaxID=1506545 RepID=A0A2H3L8I8_9CHLR|nr:hypothetical protein A9Q02_11705 [Candidatus Chloroploca asiatica]